MTALLAVLGVALLAAGWGGLQVWIARRDPENPGLARSCDGACGSCDGTCGEKCAGGRKTRHAA